MSHQAEVLFCAWERSSPQEGVSGGRPKPRKSRAEMEAMAPTRQKGIEALQYVVDNTEVGEDLHNRAMSVLSDVQKKRNSVLSKVKSIFGKK